jgi:meso-butanediol dehydrogenase / (S,S)-butanediol dehydrogenase / diacetyl reductase
MASEGGVRDKVCVVTGAGGGIGSAICERLASGGAKVCAADIDAEAAGAVAESIGARGGAAIAASCDVTNRESVRNAIGVAVAEFGRLDVMFNNAGISQVKRLIEIEEDEWNRLMSVNGLGVLIGMQEAAKRMIDQGDGGKIVNTASIAGKEGYPLFAHYCATKFAVVALTQAGARAWAEHGIKVNAFSPGVVGTQLWEQLDREFLELGETEREGQALQEFSEGILLGRVSEPEDVAGLATFLASAEADYMTGQTVQVDGGMVFH